MDFYIQISNPKVIGKCHPLTKELGDAIEDCFALESEFALIMWSGIPIPIDYKYDISILITDIIEMLHFLLNTSNGSLEIAWPSNNFNAIWTMDLKDDELTINAQWDCVTGKTEKILNNLTPLSLNKHEFICEWKSLIELLLKSLQKCGYSEEQIPDIAALKEIGSKIKSPGYLYK